MSKYVVVSCTEREIIYLGQTDNYQEAFEMMVSDFVRFHFSNSSAEKILSAFGLIGLNEKHEEKEVVDIILNRFNNGENVYTDSEWWVEAFSCWSNVVSDENYDCKILETDKDTPTVTSFSAVGLSKEEKPFFIGSDTGFGIFCNTWDEFVKYLHSEYLSRVEDGETQFNVHIEQTA